MEAPTWFCAIPTMVNFLFRSSCPNLCKVKRTYSWLFIQGLLHQVSLFRPVSQLQASEIFKPYFAALDVYTP